MLVTAHKETFIGLEIITKSSLSQYEVMIVNIC